MYEQDDGDYSAYEDDIVRPRKKIKLLSGVAFLVYGAIGVVLAQTITLNTNGRVEFGQGVVTLKACDSFIAINLTPSSATFSGTKADGTPYTNASRVKNIKFSGLDTRACFGKRIKVQLFDQINSSGMNLFTDADSINVNSVILVVDSDKTVNRGDAITLLNGKGQNIGYFDSYQYIDFNGDTGVYTLIFSNPLALMSDVYRLTVETGNV